MADEATDVQGAEINPADFDGDDPETPKADPSPAAPKTPEAAKPADKPADPPEGDEPPAPADEDEPVAPDPDNPDGKPFAKAEERKAELNTEIRDLVSQRNALKTEVEKANADAYQPATEQELEQEGMAATDAKIEAMRQRLEMREYNDKVADAQLTIESESQRVMTDFPRFDPKAAEFDEELRDQAAELMQANLILDPNTNQIIGSTVSPYQLYKTLDRAAGSSAAKGQIEGKKAAEKEAANADAPSSGAPAKKAADPVTEMMRDL